MPREEIRRSFISRLLVDYVNPRLPHYPGLRARRRVIVDEMATIWDISLPGEAITRLEWKGLSYPPELMALMHWLWDANAYAVGILIREFVDIAAIFERDVEVTINNCQDLIGLFPPLAHEFTVQRLIFGTMRVSVSVSYG